MLVNFYREIHLLYLQYNNNVDKISGCLASLFAITRRI